MIPRHLTAAAVLAMAALSCGPSRNEIVMDRFREFQEAKKLGDVERATTCLAPGFFLVLGGGESLDRAGMGDLLAWDAATGARAVCEDEGIVVEKGVVTATCTEHSTFLDLVGAAGGRKTRQVFHFGPDGFIEWIDHQTLSGQIPLREKLNPFLDWMRKKHAEELDAIIPEGRIRYSGEDAERWLALLQEWRGDIRLP